MERFSIPSKTRQMYRIGALLEIANLGWTIAMPTPVVCICLILGALATIQRMRFKGRGGVSAECKKQETYCPEDAL